MTDLSHDPQSSACEDPAESAGDAPPPAPLIAPDNLLTAEQAELSDLTTLDLRNNWSVVDGVLVQTHTNSSTQDVRMQLNQPVQPGHPHMLLWEHASYGTTGKVKPRLSGAGQCNGSQHQADNPMPPFQYFAASEIVGDYTKLSFKPSADDYDATLTAPRLFDLSTTDPNVVACDVILCLGDSNMGNAVSEPATQDNLETPYDPRIWTMPCLRVSPHAFSNTGSLRHVPQPCIEPVQASTGAARMSPVMACAGELVEWSAARGRPLLMLSLSDAGSGLNGSEDWRKTSATATTGSRMYQEMQAMLSALSALGPAHEVIGAVVSLGANDTTAADYAVTWEPEAMQFVQDLRAELSAPGLPIAWITVGEHYEPITGEDRGARMITAIERLDQDSGTAVAIPGVKTCRPPTGFALTDPTDPHFTAAGMQANGRVLGQTLLSMLP